MKSKIKTVTIKAEAVTELGAVVFRIGNWIMTPNVDGGVSVTLPGKKVHARWTNSKNTIWLREGH